MQYDRDNFAYLMKTLEGMSNHIELAWDKRNCILYKQT